VLEHELQLECDTYLAVDETLIPTGERVDAGSGPMSFRTRRRIGTGFARVDGGYDHCFVVNRQERSNLVHAAQLFEPVSGRRMEIRTTEPGLQLYTGNFLDGTPDTGGYGPQQGICLECQQFPDAPNRPEFPSTILRPGSLYRQTTVHRFDIE
jgi:aldose 1-epimerase